MPDSRALPGCRVGLCLSAPVIGGYPRHSPHNHPCELVQMRQSAAPCGVPRRGCHCGVTPIWMCLLAVTATRRPARRAASEDSRCQSAPTAAERARRRPPATAPSPRRACRTAPATLRRAPAGHDQPPLPNAARPPIPTPLRMGGCAGRRRPRCGWLVSRAETISERIPADHHGPLAARRICSGIALTANWTG
jgi:hypothetical protein